MLNYYVDMYFSISDSVDSCIILIMLLFFMEEIMSISNDTDKLILDIDNLLNEYKKNILIINNDFNELKNKYNQLLIEKNNIEDKFNMELIYNKKIYIKKGEEKAKAHLSYRLGNILVNDGKTLSGIIKMPFKMINEYKNWKKGKNNPIISVVIPVYNSEKYITQCLDSVLNQNVKNIEVICVDDGSTDGSLDILNEYASKDKRVIVKRQKNQYAGVARNAGLECAHGEFVHFLDSDDWINNNTYSKLLEIIRIHNCDVVMFSYDNFDNISKKTRKSTYFDGINDKFINVPLRTLENTELFLRAAVVPWNKIYRRSFLVNNKLKFDELMIANDRSFYFKVIKSNPSTVIIRDSLLNYRINNINSLVGKKRIQNYDCHFKSFNNMRDLFFGKKEYNTIIDLFLTDLRIFYEKSNDDMKINIKNSIKNYIRNNKKYFDNVKYLKDKRSYYFYNMIMDNECIPIVFSVDNNYIKYLSVAILSMIKNASKSYFYNIFILYTDLSDENKRKIKSLENKNCSISFHNVNYKIKSHNLYSRAHYSISMYYRILIPEIFSRFEKVIYLDCDLLVVDDISNFFFMWIGDYWIAASTNYLNKDMRKYTKWKFNLDYPKYFNSGVLLINNRKWNEHNVATQCFEYLEKVKDLVCPDQDALNVICRDKVKYFDGKWNFAWQHIVLDSDVSDEQRYEINKIINNKKSIIHYTSGVKPWKIHEWKNEYGKEWWNYAKESPFYDSILKDLENFKSKNNFVLSKNA